MSLMEQIKQKARASQKTIVLPEGTEERTAKAAALILAEGLCKLVLLGSPDAVKAAAGGADISGATIIDPANAPNAADYAQTLYELRKDKGMTIEAAQKAVTNPLYYGTLMIYKGEADGMVAGAINSTGDVLRPPLQIIKTAPGIKTVSSSMIMICPDKKYGQDGILVFADCAVNISPDAQQLADIAVATAATAKALCGMEPRVAMLSFSTKGSGKHADADKVIEATRIAREAAPQLNIDGELQADAALVESVGKLKSPGSSVAGQANVLVFPDLNAGNIGYKLVQRLAGAEAIGPIVQGLKRPVNDLSRGCSVEDIVCMAALTAVQADSMAK